MVGDMWRWALENHCTALDEDTVVELIELTLLK